MNAQPQRLSRARATNNENLQPSLLAGKGLHQRNKSSPTLSTYIKPNITTVPSQALLAQIPRRTAFADLTNNVRPQATVKDNSNVEVEPIDALSKHLPLSDNKDAANLARPAQRPLSVQAFKGFFNSLSSTAQSTNITKAVPLESQIAPLAPAPNLHKPLLKRSTTIFTDSYPITVPSIHTIQTQPQPPVHVLPLRKEVQQNKVDEQPACSNLVPVTHPSDSHLHSFKTDVDSSEADYHDTRSDGVRLEPLAPLPNVSNTSSSIHDTTEAVHQLSVEVETDVAGVRVYERNHLQPIPEDENKTTNIMPLTDGVEYWEEEDYYYADYDDGYTTAPSLKSRGDYTTGPMTIVIAPQVNSRAEEQLAAATRFVQQSVETSELEEDESWDVSMVHEYGEEIFAYMRVLEERLRPNPYYMDNQTEVQWSMRSVLMDWLIQVHHRFSLLPETLFLCVNYIDRFLSCKVVSLGKLQLVGATAIFVAAKYEEINCPSIQEIVFMVDKGYTVDEILKAERFMLSMLQFELGWPGPMSFLRRISKADDYDLETRTLAKYFLEITIMDERFVGTIPSFTAAGAHCLARLMLKKGSWSAKHIHYSGYLYNQLRPLLLAMLSCCEDPQKHHCAVFDKYGDKRFKRASFFVQSELDKGFVLPSVTRFNTVGYTDPSISFSEQRPSVGLEMH